MRQVVSLSGGKDSTAMLLMMLERGEQVDEVVFFDTGWEFPEMYEHLARLEVDTGIGITRLHADKPMDYYLYEHIISRGRHEGCRGYGWARPTARWCTTIKTSVIDMHIKGIGSDTVQCVGIAADEPSRVRDKRYPLVEWGVTEADCLAYCYARGYDWGGLYGRKRRVSCWCCPLQSLNDLKVLHDDHHDLWEKLLEMDGRTWNNLRADYTLGQLEERFDAEQKQPKLFGGEDA